MSQVTFEAALYGGLGLVGAEYLVPARGQQGVPLGRDKPPQQPRPVAHVVAAVVPGHWQDVLTEGERVRLRDWQFDSEGEELELY